MSSAIPQDAPTTNEPLDMDSAAERLLEGWKKKPDGESPSEPQQENDEDAPHTEEADDTEDSDASPEDDGSEESDSEQADEDAEREEDDSSEDDESEEAPRVLKDKDVVKVSVDGQEIDVPVEKLKRLYGQEASLTRKSQEAAALRKQADEAGAKHVAATEKLIERAYERYKPYEQIDWLVAAKRLEPDELVALRTEATKAYEDVQYLSQELDGFMKNVYETRQKSMVEEARTTLKNLQDPVKGIKGFDDKMYDEMRVFAINQGIPQEVVNNIVSEPMIRLLHSAMLYEKGRARTVTKPTAQKNKTIIKGNKTPETTRKVVEKGNKDKPIQRLKRSGTTDDAAEALLSRWRED